MTLRYEHVSFDYDGASVLTDVSFAVDVGEVVGLVGSSGAGKSTALALGAGLLAARTGSVTTLGVNLAVASVRQRRSVAGSVGFVPQQPVIPGPLRVVHAVNAGRLAHWTVARSIRSLVWPAGVAEARAALARVGIDDLIDARADALSGGQLQRVALARVLVSSRQLVLADEPTSAVDPRWSTEVLTTLREVAMAGAAVLVSLHDVGLAFEHCDRVVGLRDGQVMFDSPVGAVSDAAMRELYRFDHDDLA